MTPITLIPTTPREVLVDSIAKAIEAKPEYVATEMADLIDSLYTSTDLIATIRAYMPNAEWGTAVQGLANRKYTTEAPQWLREFGADFECPECPEFLSDQSWHNDVCPNFTLYDDATGENRVTIWINHPDEERRELAGMRYLVTSGTDLDFEMATDDWKEAVETAHKMVLLAVAMEFSKVVNGWLTPEQMEQVRTRNASSTDPLVCASHDFCDANMAMSEALNNLHINTFPNADGMPEWVMAIWNAAWEIAKNKGFKVEGE